MLADRYDLSLSTASAAARDAYVQGCDLALTLYPGAIEAFDRAIAADAGFALAHAGKAQVLMREGKVAAARAALAAAKDRGRRVPPREASHIAFFDLVFAGQTDAAIAAMHAHLSAWPRDALVVATAANPNGLIGASGRIGQKHQIAVLMDSLAPHYGDDFWFLAYHAMALSEDGQLAAARPKIERSVATEPEQRARRARVRACLLRERRAGYRPRLPVVLARHLSARWIFPWPSELASLAVRTSGRQLGGGVAAVSGRHRARPAQRRAAAENVGCDSVSVAFRTRRPSARRRRLARDARLCQRLRCRGRAAGSPTCTSSWRRPSWATTPRSTPVPARWRIWRARGATRPALIFRRCRAASRRSSAGISPRRSTRSRRSPEKTNALAAAARSTT